MASARKRDSRGRLLPATKPPESASVPEPAGVSAPAGQADESAHKHLSPDSPPMLEPAEADRLASAVATFKEGWPLIWAQIALCPLQHGLEQMIATMRGGKT